MARLVNITQQVNISYVLKIAEDSSLFPLTTEDLSVIANSGLEFELLSGLTDETAEGVVFGPKVRVGGYATPTTEEIQ